jgi:S1-C subfamily serine protease
MGVNVAVAQAENIGFAIPINVVKDSIKNFNETGQFDRPMLGVRYKMIPQETALLNDVPEGAYIIEVLPNSTAAKMQVQIGDIITKLNGQTVNQEAGDLAALINKMRVGDTIILDIWRGGELLTLQGELQIASN